MNGNDRQLSLIAAALALALGTSQTIAQEREDDERAEEIQQAEDRLDRAEDGLVRAEERVEQRQEDLEQARASAATELDRSAVDRDVDDRDTDGRFADASRASSELAGITEEHAELSSFMEALEATGLGDSLTGSTSYTVFAPTNEAFDDRWNELEDADDREELVRLLRAHIVADDVDAETARTLDRALTVDGGLVEISEHDGEVMVGDAKVVDWDITAGNLRVHAIDGVLDADPAPAAAALRDDDADRGAERDLDPALDADVSDRESARDN